jgi:hypothetical protein
MEEISCKNPEHRVDRRKCTAHWPHYPCYSKKNRSCYDSQGEILLFDPVSSIIQIATELFLSVIHTMEQLMLSKEYKMNDDKIREFAQERMTTLMPFQNPLHAGLDIARYKYLTPGQEKQLENILEPALERALKMYKQKTRALKSKKTKRSTLNNKRLKIKSKKLPLKSKTKS